MADPPPKKIGSLRDRIAAFENKGPAAAPAPSPPIPRPKPGGVSWKPRAASPPPAPAAAADTTDDSAEKKPAGAGMSAADAKQSIQKGGSLKERMAALQGLSAFGGGSPAAATSPPPRPSGDKPRWKPPPPVVSPPVEEKSEEQAGVTTEKEDLAERPAEDEVKTGGEDVSEAAPGEPAAKELQEQKQDEEDEERQRRAAIAARMARLGGARIGFAPPVVAKKPVIKKAEEPRVEESKEPKDDTKEVVSPPAVQSPPEGEAIPEPAKDSSGEYFTQTNASASSLLSPEPPSSAPRSPSMPVPAVPRRAAPPRKKAPKSPAPPISDPEAQLTESPASGTPQETSDEGSKMLQGDVSQSKMDEAALGLAPATLGSGSQDSAAVNEQAAPKDNAEEVIPKDFEESATKEPATEEPAVEEPAIQEPLEEAPTQAAEPGPPEPTEDEHVIPEQPLAEESISAEQPASPKEPQTLEPKEEKEEEEHEEDETERRKRIAERLRQQGGFNPFTAPPPIRKPSIPPSEVESKSPTESVKPAKEPEEPVEHTPASPPSPPRRQSTRKGSTDTASLSPVISKHGSMDHVQTPAEETVSSPIPSKHVEQEKKSSASEGDSDKKEEAEDDPYAADSWRSPTAISQMVSEEPEDDVEETADNHERVSDESTPTSPHDRAASENEPEPEVRLAYGLQTEEEQPEFEDVTPSHELPGHTEAQTEPVTLPSLHPTRVSLPPPPKDIPAVLQKPPSSNTVPDPALHQPLSPAVLEPAESLDYDDPVVEALPHVSLEVQPTADTHSMDSPVAAYHDAMEQQDEDIDEVRQSPVSPIAPSLPSRRLSTEVRSPTRSLPLPPPVHPTTEVNVPEDEEPEHIVEETVVESEIIDESAMAQEDEESNEHQPTEDVVNPRVKLLAQIQTQQHPRHASDSLEREILNDSDVDPIDPGFVSPQKTASSATFPSLQSPRPPESPVVPEPTAETTPEQITETVPEEDEEQARRRTIAERMAKLGGIRFGAPPPIGRRPPPPPEFPHVEHEQEKEDDQEKEVEEEPAHTEAEEPEEDEAARRARIAARIAGMGGMRFGMVPTPPAPAPAVPSESDDEAAPPLPPPRSVSIPPPPRQAPVESDSESEAPSDIVEVEAVESELEEVTHDDAEEETPPPLPSRAARQASTPQSRESPAMPRTRPPVPTGRPPVPSAFSPPPPPSAFSPPLPPPSHGDFVMVDEADAEEPPPLPPPRSHSLKKEPPRRNVPPPPPPPSEPSIDLAASGTSNWESTVDFGDGTDLSLSGQWSEDSTQYPPAPPTNAPEPPIATVHLTSDELIAQWGRVGVQVHEVATTLYERSKKALVGDRSYVGFISAVLSQVPNASKPSPPYDTFGQLIYEQSGSSVLRHTADIMPGDIIVLHDAKLKGHKGIQSYHQNVGAGEPVSAIVGDFEHKKSKVKAFQANQHVGHDSVESVSYRLEDLKSGSVRIFRVLEA